MPDRPRVRVNPSGVRSYIIQYRNRNTGASKCLTIGTHGLLLTFDQAKKQARAILADAMRGEDPVEVRKAARTAPSAADLAADYLETQAVPKPQMEDPGRPRDLRLGCGTSRRHRPRTVRRLGRVSEAPYSTPERNAALWRAASKRPGFVLLVVLKQCGLPMLSDHMRRCDLFDLPEEQRGSAYAPS
jgi:Arm DNA-binding domain